MAWKKDRENNENANFGYVAESWLMTNHRFNRQLRFARARVQTMEFVFQQQNAYYTLEPFHLVSVTLKCKFAKLNVASVAESTRGGVISILTDRFTREAQSTRVHCNQAEIRYGMGQSKITVH